MTAQVPIETLRLPERVAKDVAGYRSGVARFQSGEINEVAFRAFRVPMGVYEHRQAGRFMVRVRLGAGLASPEQLEHVAALAVKFGNGVVHVTTRQDLQIHDVALEDTIAVVERLLDAGLSARGGGGNTVRNVTACPRALVCPKAIFDVAPHALTTAEYLLQTTRSYNLPRKYKIAFSGCSEDCAFASVNDLGFFAHERVEQQGFAVYAGGGLGPQAAAGILIEEFIPADQIYLVAEAIERLFDRLGDRANKHQARLRYVLRRLGEAAFVAEYRKERAVVEREGLAAPVPTLRPFPPAARGAVPTGGPAPVPPDNFLTERDPTRLTLRVTLHNGRIPAKDLAAVAKMARELGIGLVVATQQQDLLVLGIPVGAAGDALAALAELGIEARSRNPKVVACAGASTCKLGLCLSPALADAIAARLSQSDTEGNGPESIRLSGCPNACGNHSIATLGFEGCARRHADRLLPLYEVLAGGQVGEGKARFAERLGSVPARIVPELVAEIHAKGLRTVDEIRPVVERFARLSEPVPAELFVDLGSTEPFSLASRGPGECGAGVLDIIRVDLEEAGEALVASEQANGTDKSPDIRRAIAASARALLPLFGVEARKEREVFRAVAENLIVPGWVSADVEDIFSAAIDWRLGDRPSLKEVLPQVRSFHRRVRELFGSLDGSLRFQVQRLAPEAPAAVPALPTVAKLLDLSGVDCPMNFVKAKVALEKLAVGETLEVRLDDGEPVRNVPTSFTEQGQEVLGITAEGKHFRVQIRRRR